MSEKRDLVVFLNVQRSYPPHQDLQAFYQRDTELKPTSRDWVGLFRVGWSSSRDYYTFEWVLSAEETTKGNVTQLVKMAVFRWKAATSERYVPLRRLLG